MSLKWGQLHSKDSSWLLKFPLKEGRELLIPCVTYFICMYGQSSELHRILVTYPFMEVVKRCLGTFEGIPDSQSWPVCIQNRMRDLDAVLLAHMQHDEYAAGMLKKIYSVIETQFTNKAPCFLKVAPWTRDSLQMQVEGRWINNGRTFLALRITGASEPAGPPIQLQRSLEISLDDEDSDGSLADDEDTPQFRRQITPPADPIDLNDRDEPGGGSTYEEIQAHEFAVLGDPRTVKKVKREDGQLSSRGVARFGDAKESFSTGIEIGGSSKVGVVNIISELTLESQGSLRDMWNSMQGLTKANPAFTQLQYFSATCVFLSSSEPRLISFVPFGIADKSIDTETRNWVYKTKGILRGLLIARFLYQANWIYIAEIERKSWSSQNDTDQSVREESYLGLVFRFNPGINAESWCEQLPLIIRAVRGRLNRLPIAISGEAKPFVHARYKESAAFSKARQKSISQKRFDVDNVRRLADAALHNALSKLGIILR